jgi:hypothetical protein
MRWELSECNMCGGVAVVPEDCAARVRAGESLVVCDQCFPTYTGGVKGPKGEANPLRPPGGPRSHTDN